MQFRLYFSGVPAPREVTRTHLDALTPVHFSTEQDALHAAALVLRGGQHVWLIEGPNLQLSEVQVARRCEPILQLFRRR